MKKKLFMILLCGCALISLTGCGKEEYYCCDDGSTPEDGKCLRAETMTTDVVYTCPNGYTAKTDGVCYRSNGQLVLYAVVQLFILLKQMWWVIEVMDKELCLLLLNTLALMVEL